MGQLLIMTETETALNVYAKFFPTNTPTIFQQEMIEDAVKDLKIWQEALTYWAGNDYRPQSIQKLVDYYRQLIGEKPTFGYGKRSPNADCDKCNNERRIRSNVESWPCDQCRPQELMAWDKARGRR